MSGSAERGRARSAGAGKAERRGRGKQSGGANHPAPMAPVEQRAAALEALLTERGLVPQGFIEDVTRRYETEIGPMNGAKVVARAWTDPAYRQRLLADGTAAIAELGFGGSEGDHMVVVENTPGVHNVIVCTLCSCYPWPTLGLPPAWYKDPPYRARMVREPRTLLAEMGCELPEDVEIRVWDSSAEVRYLVLPQRPPGTEGMAEAELAGLVTRDSMIGVARL
jgi:nitrile hydratase subunit alpha